VIVDAFDALVRVTLAGSAAILLVLLARGFLRHRFGAQVAYVAWTLVPAVIVAMLLPAPTHPVTPLAGIVRIAALEAAPVDVVADTFDPRGVLLVLWLVGALLAAVWFAQQQRRYLRGLGRLRMRDGARIVQSDCEFAGPALVGAWRARIVLPCDFDARYDERERELILAHEFIHFARGDAWVNALVVALRSLNWFNPLLHYAAAKFRIDQELACDAAVIARFPQARRQYADAMLKVQLAGQPRQELRLPVGCRWPSDRTLKERILMLKQSRPTRARRITGLALVAMLGLGCAYTTWATQAPPPSAAVTSHGSSSATDHPHADHDASYASMKPPHYPEEAVKNKIEGTVWVKVAIAADGSVQSADVYRVEPETAASLGVAAVQAVKSWTFNPAMKYGYPVAGNVLVPIEFSLDRHGVATMTPKTGDTPVLDTISTTPAAGR
jgi:TonB family protein